MTCSQTWSRTTPRAGSSATGRPTRARPSRSQSPSCASSSTTDDSPRPPPDAYGSRGNTATSSSGSDVHVLVTGAHGFLAQAVISELDGAGHQVATLTRRPSTSTGFPACVTDLVDRDQTMRVLDGT